MKCANTLLTFFVLMFVLLASTADARQIVRSQHLSAHVAKSFQCAPEINLTIQAPNARYFKNDTTELQRLVGSARSILGFECNQIKKIKIVGTVNNQPKYQAHSYASDNWRVISSRSKKVARDDSKMLARDGDLSVSVDDNCTCDRSMTLNVYAPSQSYFKGNAAPVQKLVASVRGRLEQNCSTVEAITVHGYVDGEQAPFRMYASKRRGWKLRNSVDREFLSRLKEKQRRASEPPQQVAVATSAAPVKYVVQSKKIYYQVDPAVVTAIDRLVDQAEGGVSSAYNLPEPKKIYEDESGSYYGVMMSNNGAFPSQVSEQNVGLYIAVIRRPDSQGRIIEVIPKRVQDRKGHPVDGYAFGKSEIERVNKHILPRVKQLYDKKWYTSGLYFICFLEGYHFGHSKDPFHTEEWLFGLGYSFDSSGYLIPSYEKRGLAGIPKDHILPTVKDALNSRRQLPESERKEGLKARVKAMFAYHEQDYAKRKQEQFQELRRQMESDRKKGTIYLSNEYWDEYKNLDTARKIFDGQFHFIEDVGDFAYTYLSYIDNYYKVCEAHLPSKVTSFSAKYFSTEYGITTLDKEYYVKMEPRFADTYEEIRVANKSEVSNKVLASFFKKGTLESSKDVLSIISEQAAVAAQMQKFLNGSCRSARVRQFGDNLYAAAHGLKSVQTSNKHYPNAENESESITWDDVRRYQNLSSRHFARNLPDKSKGFPYVEEELTAYRRGFYAEDGVKFEKDGTPEKKHAKLRSIGSEIALEKHPVLACYYGPVGFYPSGKFKYYSYSFWYVEAPSQLKRFLAARTKEKDVYPGLSNVVSSCPRDSNVAHRIIYGD